MRSGREMKEKERRWPEIKKKMLRVFLTPKLHQMRTKDVTRVAGPSQKNRDDIKFSGTEISRKSNFIQVFENIL